MANMLQLKNVTVSYKNVPTVQNFNLDMKQGQIVSLVGESGSGKTTVIRAVLGLLAGGGMVSGEVLRLRERICFPIIAKSGETCAAVRSP